MEKTAGLIVRWREVESWLVLCALLLPIHVVGLSRQRERISHGFYRTESIETIVKESESYTYPPDGFYRIVQDKRRNLSFPCDNVSGRLKWRSDTRPTSVHKLRPGDIDVIAAMGDSLTAANLARERVAIGIVIQDRGVSFTGGGAGTWHDFTTLPNIIKVFNPNLTGYAIGRGDFASHNAQLNVAIAASLDDDLINQVKLFMVKMHQNPRINFKNDWKLLSIMIGDNDVCSKECHYKRKHSPQAHKFQLQKALDYLYKNVPRLFVNIISMLDPTIAARIPTTSVCDNFLKYGCNCLYQHSNVKEGIIQVASMVREYQDAEKELVASGRYDGREDFTVEVQPLFNILNAPKKLGEPENPGLFEFFNSELPLWTPECFHFNQRGLAAASIALWNNMLEPSGNKTMTFAYGLRNKYKCPTERNPYFFTTKNSRMFLSTGHQ